MSFELISDVVQYVLCIYNDKNEMLVGIKPDGSVEHGPGFTTTEQAAKDFWEIMGRSYPNIFKENT